jgi:hypothetical protein
VDNVLNPKNLDNLPTTNGEVSLGDDGEPKDSDEDKEDE